MVEGDITLKRHFDNLKGMYSGGMIELEEGIKEIDTEKMNLSAQLVGSSITLLAIFFPGEYVFKIGESAISAFGEAYKAIPETNSKKEIVGERIRELRSFVEEYRFSKDKEKRRSILQKVIPEALHLADNFASACVG